VGGPGRQRRFQAVAAARRTCRVPPPPSGGSPPPLSRFPSLSGRGKRRVVAGKPLRATWLDRAVGPVPIFLLGTLPTRPYVATRVPVDTSAHRHAVSYTCVAAEGRHHRAVRHADTPTVRRVDKPQTGRDGSRVHTSTGMPVDTSDRGRAGWWEPATKRGHGRWPEATRRHVDTSTARHEDGWRLRQAAPRRMFRVGSVPLSHVSGYACGHIGLHTCRTVDMFAA
jgi:hypothetical protein